jgi:hypothetical protein
VIAGSNARRTKINLRYGEFIRGSLTLNGMEIPRPTTVLFSDLASRAETLRLAKQIAVKLQRPVTVKDEDGLEIATISVPQSPSRPDFSPEDDCL